MYHLAPPLPRLHYKDALQDVDAGGGGLDSPILTPHLNLPPRIPVLGMHPGRLRTLIRSCGAPLPAREKGEAEEEEEEGDKEGEGRGY